MGERGFSPLHKKCRFFNGFVLCGGLKPHQPRAADRINEKNCFILNYTSIQEHKTCPNIRAIRIFGAHFCLCRFKSRLFAFVFQ
jgi:hypothetical protein